MAAVGWTGQYVQAATGLGDNTAAGSCQAVAVASSTGWYAQAATVPARCQAYRPATVVAAACCQRQAATAVAVA